MWRLTLLLIIYSVLLLGCGNSNAMQEIIDELGQPFMEGEIIELDDESFIAQGNMNARGGMEEGKMKFFIWPDTKIMTTEQQQIDIHELKVDQKVQVWMPSEPTLIEDGVHPYRQTIAGTVVVE